MASILLKTVERVAILKDQFLVELDEIEHFSAEGETLNYEE